MGLSPVGQCRGNAQLIPLMFPLLQAAQGHHGARLSNRILLVRDGDEAHQPGFSAASHSVHAGYRCPVSLGSFGMKSRKAEPIAQSDHMSSMLPFPAQRPKSPPGTTRDCAGVSPLQGPGKGRFGHCQTTDAHFPIPYIQF